MMGKNDGPVRFVRLACGIHWGPPTWIEGTSTLVGGKCSKCRCFSDMPPRDQAGPMSIISTVHGNYDGSYKP